jgi:hypothetical protein
MAHHVPGMPASSAASTAQTSSMRNIFGWKSIGVNSARMLVALQGLTIYDARYRLIEHRDRGRKNGCVPGRNREVRSESTNGAQLLGPLAASVGPLHTATSRRNDRSRSTE